MNGSQVMLWRKLAADKKCPQLKRQTTTLGSPPCSLREVWVLLSPLTERSRDWAYGLMSLSEKTRRSIHLQMLEQWQHLLLSYFKTPSVGPAGNRTQASRTADWRLTNWAHQAVILIFRSCIRLALFGEIYFLCFI